MVKKGAKGRATVTVRIIDAAGNRRTQKLRIRLR